MDTQQVFTYGQQSLYVLLMISAPVLITVLAVGLLVSIFQAATQIHEATLSFVPKTLYNFIRIESGGHDLDCNSPFEFAVNTLARNPVRAHGIDNRAILSMLRIQ